MYMMTFPCSFSFLMISNSQAFSFPVSEEVVVEQQDLRPLGQRLTILISLALSGLQILHHAGRIDITSHQPEIFASFREKRRVVEHSLFLNASRLVREHILSYRHVLKADRFLMDDADSMPDRVMGISDPDLFLRSGKYPLPPVSRCPARTFMRWIYRPLMPAGQHLRLA